MPRLLVIGASSGIGLETVTAALTAGLSVRAFARSASRIEATSDALDKVDGDARDAAAIRAALPGCDAVVQSLGVPLSPATVLGGTRLFSEATRVLVDAMEAAADGGGPRRLIVVTGVGAGDSRDALGPLYRAAFTATLSRIYDDKDVQEMMVRRSRLDWTLLRPGFLTSGPAKPCRVLLDRAEWRAGSVARASVAQVIVTRWPDVTLYGQTPVLIDL